MDVKEGVGGLLKEPKEEEIEHYAKNPGKITRGASIAIGGNAAGVGVAENVLKQVLKILDNWIDADEKE